MPMLVITESKINGIYASDFYKSLNSSSGKYIPKYFVLTREIKMKNWKSAGTLELIAFKQNQLK